MKREICTVAGLAMLVAAAPVAAQPAARETFPLVGVFGYPAYAERGAATPMRRARPTGSVVDWLPDSDPAVTRAKTTNETGYVSLDLAVDGNGRVIGCKLNPPDMAPALSAGLCDRISAKARMTPAIDEAGASTPDRYTFNIAFNRSYEGRSPVVVLMPPAPAPPPPGAQWPPNADSMTVTVDKLDRLDGGPDSPLAFAAPWAGVIYSPEAAGERCKIVLSSGDAGFDKRACAAAAKGRYAVSADAESYRRRIQLHFVLADGKPRALAPVQKWTSRAAASEPVRAAVAAALPPLPGDASGRLTLDVRVDAAGAPTGCRIETSSGSDAADVAACAAARKAGPYVPAKDIFGRPLASALYDWNPTRPTSP